MRLNSTDLQLSPALALAALLHIDDTLVSDRKAVALVRRPDTLVVLVDTATAWGAWVHAIGEAADAETEFHRGDHLLTAQNVVAGWPVLVLEVRPEPTPASASVTVKALAAELHTSVTAVSFEISRLCRKANPQSVVTAATHGNGGCTVSPWAADEIRKALAGTAVAA